MEATEQPYPTMYSVVGLSQENNHPSPTSYALAQEISADAAEDYDGSDLEAELSIFGAKNLLS